MRVSVETSKAMRFLNVIEPPGFDLGFSPMKDVQTQKAVGADASGSGVTKDKGKGKLIDDNQAPKEAGFNRGVTQGRNPEAVTNTIASDSCGHLLDKTDIKPVIAPKKEEQDSINDSPGMTNNDPPVENITLARPSRRNAKPGDHLKSPYVVRIVDFNVSAEDKRAHEWVLSIFGGKVDTVFHTNDCVHIFRTGMDTLAATNMNISPSVINGWASILNYEERFKNRDSIRQYFFSTEMMMHAGGEKTQYDSCLEEAERCRPNLMKMKDIDLKNATTKEIDHFTSLDLDIKAQILRQDRESRFERLEF
ncbi:hypothetical protein L6452_21955 [Arctium lappa]|uniref:Uncharacterized protein n=1 Tax=Arctium lappa TaxID=4217 RepID=A0ACB9AXW5_ARCLA|nr:hypothetical protein L6452_21955 [Arctium lappa]